jgi:hypothetical protein
LSFRRRYGADLQVEPVNRFRLPCQSRQVHRLQRLPRPLGDKPPKSGRTIEGSEAFEVEQHHLATATEDDLEIWRAVEGAGRDEAHELDASLVTPAEPVCRQRQVDLERNARVEGAAHHPLRDLRVDEQRHAERGRPF